MTKKLVNIYRNALKTVRRKLMKTSLEQFICFGVKSDMPQKANYGCVCRLFADRHPAAVTARFVEVRYSVHRPSVHRGQCHIYHRTGHCRCSLSLYFFGQFVILLLIQMGGLGYMTLSSYVMLKLTGRFGSDKAKLFQIQFAVPDTFDSEVMLKSIVKYTFSFELLGFVLLCPYFLLQGTAQPVWSAMFHSVSAFCTAGFSIYSDNLMQFESDVYVNVVIMVLCIAGAMGFIMMTDISKWITQKHYKNQFYHQGNYVDYRPAGPVGNRPLVLLRRFISASAQGERWMASLFQSISAMTTVGYNTVDVSQMVPISLLILTITMYIGASPSGTGGGLKSTTISALYAYTKCALEFRNKVSLCGNVIPRYRITSALTTVLFYTFILFVGIYPIGLFEPDDADFLKISFEAVSALATAGLTSGILSDITIGSKVVLVLLMYIGRVGVITFGNVMLAGKEESIKGKHDIAV